MPGLTQLAHAWHEKVIADEVVSHAFSHGYRPDHTQRLAAYWAEALGGPAAYTRKYGDETAVVRTHSGNGEHEEMDRRAIACFDDAPRRQRAGRRRSTTAGAARLLRLGDDHDDVALSPVGGRRPHRAAAAPLVLGRARRPGRRVAMTSDAVTSGAMGTLGYGYPATAGW
ncbi:MAG: hypothetical protein ACR2JO_14445 [Mycobacteriales bacterium]